MNNDAPHTTDTTKVTRIEIIDQNGRRFVTHAARDVAILPLQDEGRTLKVFYHEEITDAVQQTPRIGGGSIDQ